MVDSPQLPNSGRVNPSRLTWWQPQNDTELGCQLDQNSEEDIMRKRKCKKAVSRRQCHRMLKQSGILPSKRQSVFMRQSLPYLLADFPYASHKIRLCNPYQALNIRRMNNWKNQGMNMNNPSKNIMSTRQRENFIWQTIQKVLIVLHVIRGFFCGKRGTWICLQLKFFQYLLKSSEHFLFDHSYFLKIDGILCIV